jgi:porin
MRYLWLVPALVLMLSPAYAQQDKKTDDLKPSDPDTGESTVEEKTLGLLPNPFEKRGIKFAATYIGEVIGNPTGGAKQSTVYEDRLNLAVDADLQKLFGLDGIAFHANIFQIDGGGLSRGSVLNLLDVSGIEALPTTRLYEIWFEKKWKGDKIALRAGQLAADSEFATSKYTDVFTNASLGWPGIFALNMPSGGPSPPLATMGARFRADVTDNLTLVGAVFDGNAAGPGPDDPQLRDRYGINFRINDPPLFLSEAQFQWNSKKGDQGLDGKLKIGGWRHLGSFDDQHVDTNGVSLANPASSGAPASFAGDYGVYTVLEQKIFRVNGDDDRGVGVFVRASYSPPNRNLIDLYADCGLELVGLQDARPHDKFGVAIAYAHISQPAQTLDRDFRSLYGPTWPLRTSEALFTGVYQYEVRAGLTLQPNVQFIRHPGGGATNPTGSMPGVPLKDALVLGMRTVVKF